MPGARPGIQMPACLLHFAQMHSLFLTCYIHTQKGKH